MVDTPVVETEADELIRLLTTVPEIPMADAAKRLHITEGAIESLATFLEEEGVISVQYKLTIPYLSLVSHAKSDAGLDTPPHPGLPSESLTQMGLLKAQSLSDTEQQLKDLSETWSSIPEADLLSKLGVLIDTLGNRSHAAITPTTPPRYTQTLRNEFASAVRVHNEIKKHNQMGEKSVAKELCGELVYRLKGMVHKLAAVELVNEYAPLLPENSAQVSAKVRELVDGERFEEAEALYNLMKEKAVEFPRTFYRRELQFDTDLSQLNQELFSASEKNKSERFTRMAKDMDRMMKEVDALLKKKELRAAEDIVHKLKLLLSELPEMHPGQKAELESKILRLSGTVLSQKGDFHIKTFQTKTGIIRGLIKDLDSSIQRHEMDKAPELYREVKVQFESLPDSFPDRKLQVQGEILAAYERLSQAYKEFNEASFRAMEKDLLAALADMAVQIRMNQLERAAEYYYRIKRIFYGLPPGHLQRKVELQGKVLEVFEVFKKKYPQAVLEKFVKVQSEIKLALVDAHKTLAMGNLQLAWNRYYGMLELFKRLPLIGAEQRKDVRMQILSFYRQLLQVTDEQHMRHLDHKQNEAYQRLLSALMKFHDLVHEREFGQLQPTFALMSQLFHELPLKVVNTDNRLKTELALLSQEINLYNQALHIGQLRRSGNHAQANLLSEKARVQLAKLRAQSPTDEELFAYIDASCTLVAKELSMTPGMRGRTPAELPHLDVAIKEMNTIANEQSPTEQAPADLSVNEPSAPPAAPPRAALAAPPLPPMQSQLGPKATHAEVLDKIESLKRLAFPGVKMPS